MPRTKGIKAPKKLNKEQINEIMQLKAKWEAKYKEALEELDENCTSATTIIKHTIKLARQNYPSRFTHLTIRDIREGAENMSSIDNTSRLCSTYLSSRDISVLNGTRSALKSNLKKPRNQSSDEGYVTTESRRTISLDRSRKQSPGRTTKGRMSRSLSRSKLTKTVMIRTPSPKEKTFTTPEKRMPIPGTYGFVTPKVKPNSPLTVLRCPKEGEVAISMQGSPLLVTGGVSDLCANVNIPLEGGRVLSLQPGRDIRMSQLPVIPDSTRQQLVHLRDHLNKVCNVQK